MMTLSEFVLARLDLGPMRWTADDPARVLATCAAHREIIAAAWSDQERIEGEWGMGKDRDEMENVGDYPRAVLAIASIYADHPDYRDEWRMDS